MAVNKEIKSKVNEAWLTAIPKLSMFAQNKLYKVVGPIIIGFELIKSPFSDNYSPHFVIYPLWKHDVKGNFDYPILLKKIKNKMGFEYNIPYEKHTLFFNDVIISIQNQTQLVFDENISLKKILSVLDEFSQSPPLSAAPNSFLQAALQEAKLKIVLFVNVDIAQRILKEISERNWDTNHFKACGIELNKWLQGLNKTISTRDDFLKQIEMNKQDKKIAKLNFSDINP